MVRRSSDAAELPTFEEKFGYPGEGFVLTRVERQIAAGRIPSALKHVGALKALADFNPFDRLELLTGYAPEPTLGECGSAAYLMGRGLRSLVD